MQCDQRSAPGNWIGSSKARCQPRSVTRRRPSSLSAPRATIFNASSGSGRCNAFASSHGARIQTSRSSSVVETTGIAFGE
jgi:hypothetical protein